MGQRFPNLYCVGAARGGTTALYRAFEAHDQIFTPLNKEPFYYTFKERKVALHNDRFIKLHEDASSEQAYLHNYSGWEDEPWAIDGSTSYLTTPGAAAAIARNAPSSKILMVLREPVSRAYSHYLMERRDGWVSGSFENALEREIVEMAQPHVNWALHYAFIRHSRYLPGLKAFHRCFGSENVRVFLYEDLRERPKQVFSELCKFLGIRDVHMTPIERPANAFAQSRFPWMQAALNRYRFSPLRSMVNKVAPRALRDQARQALKTVNLRSAEYPTISEEARQIVESHLKGDYERVLAYALENGLCGSDFEPRSVQLTA